MEEKSLLNLEFDKVLLLLAERASSRAGKDAIKSSPVTTDKSQIEKKLQEISEFLFLSQIGMRPSVRGQRDIREILELLQENATALSSEDFLKIKANSEIASRLKKIVSEISKEDRRKAQIILDRIEATPTLAALAQKINDTIDEQGNLRPDASPALAGIRRDYSKTLGELEKNLNSFLASSSDNLQDRYYTVRNERYVVPVKASCQQSVPGIVHDQSSTGQTLFIEPIAFIPANNRLAQLRLSEKEEIRRIFKALTSFTVSSQSQLEEQFQTLVWLDTVAARADFAIEYNASKPEISEQQVVRLSNARHPLLGHDCVPMSVTLSPKQKCIIITGPNGGGKTISLKTVGLNALLMQTGNYVLADEGAKLPIFEHVLADIGESQSIEEHLSSFTGHLKRLKEISELTVTFSLILIDEICVGTDPAEGAALASGFLKEMTKRGAYAIVTSHYDSLKKTAFTTEGFTNAAMEFDYKTLKPTFRFMTGIPGKSNALAMARLYGLDENILAELTEINSAEGDEEKTLIEAIERERTEAERLRREYNRKLSEIKLKEEETDRILDQLREFRKTKRDSVTEDFIKKHKQALKDSEQLISDLKTVIKDLAQAELPNREESKNKSHEALEKIRKHHKNIKQSINHLETPQDDFFTDIKRHRKAVEKTGKTYQFQEGDRAIWNFNMQEGVISKIAEKNYAFIDIGGKILKVKLSDLTYSKKTEKKEASTHKISFTATAATIDERLDLRGLQSHEAIFKLEDYLKLAEQNNLGRLFIVHGKGTGALQKAVTAYLKNSPYKKKFRPGRYGEGDSGVTIVVFNPDADVEPEQYKTDKRK
ncbi:MAG: hypothetical protein GX221_11480 [Candidatus Riflebacteria bacterium]|nr:hypothetical protein [Candidatus Riflebacteria bacterium]